MVYSHLLSLSWTAHRNPAFKWLFSHLCLSTFLSVKPHSVAVIFFGWLVRYDAVCKSVHYSLTVRHRVSVWLGQSSTIVSTWICLAKLWVIITPLRVVHSEWADNWLYQGSGKLSLQSQITQNVSVIIYNPEIKPHFVVGSRIIFFSLHPSYYSTVMSKE